MPPYCRNADGKKGGGLKRALAGIIYSHTELECECLREAFKITDARGDGKVWDMYSGVTDFTFGDDQAGNHEQEGDVYNRERSFPKSWFNGNVPPMYTDLVNLVPTYGYVNGRRGDYPFGETDGETCKSNGGFSKLGASTVSGYTGAVFEPNDEYNCHLTLIRHLSYLDKIVILLR